MSLDEMEDFIYKACLQDWKKEYKKQEKLKKILDKGKTVRITGKDTDITFSIAGRKGLLCCGNRNMPDGEVFIGPVENTTQGFIRYTYPALYCGREVTNVYLEFNKGKVTKATADKGEKLLKEIIATDNGSRKYAGTFFLISYWLGRNQGFITESE